jgi:hypothetical protein
MIPQDLIRREENMYWLKSLVLNDKDTSIFSIKTILTVSGCLIAVLMGTGAIGAEQNPAATHGVFMGHKWRIDKNHLIRWNDKPYVRYGFTGNGSMDQFIKLGFNQFNVCPSEELWVFSKSRTDNMEAIRQVDEYTDELVKRGATYYLVLNPLWPWKGSGKIAQDDMVESLFKMTWNVTEFSGRKHALRLSTTTERESQFNKSKMRAYLFDMEAGKHEEISATLKNIITSSEEIRESPTEVTEATKHTFIFEKMQLPISRDLRVTIVLPFHTEMVPQVYPSSFPALWKPTIAGYYRKGLTSFSKALAKEGLRGMMFGDEINSYRVTFPNAEVYVNFNGDEVALHAYRDWLKKKYRKIDELNGYLGIKYDNFGQVNWHICIYPFLEEELEDEDPWKGIKNTFGLFASASQMRKIDELQEDFRVWFYGHWLAEYGKMAKEIIGNVPVFITSAGIGGDADNYLQIHKQAMLEGLDGLVRNHYAYVKKSQAGRFDTFEVWSNRRFPLETVTSLLDSVQKEGGKTKTYMANEFGCPKKGGHDDFGLGDQFSFQSKDDLRNFLHVLIENGYKGFNMFKMNPNVEAAQEEVKWLSELKGEIVKDTIARTNYRKEIRITAKEAIRVARQVPKLKSLIKRYPNVRPSAAFNSRYSVWVVEFVSDNREVGFASISSDGRVLEVETK